MAAGGSGNGEAASGDHLQTTYWFWLVGDDLEHGRFPWRDPYSFRPEAHWPLNPGGWPFGFLFWPLWRAFGLVPAWNIFVLLSFVAAGAFTCAWLRELGLSRGASLAGGLAFAIAPYRVSQSTGHLLGPMSIMLPLALFAFERGLRRSRWWFVLSAAALTTIPLGGQVHLAIGAVAFFLAYAFVRTREPLLLAVAGVAVALAAGAGWFIHHEVIAGSIASGGRSLKAVEHYSADWIDFVSRHQRQGPEQFVFLGWLTLAVAAVGLMLLWRQGRRGLAAVLAGGAILPILLALGTNTPLYRPARFVFPPLRFPRVPERLLPVACLALAALVAVAVEEAEKRGAPRAKALLDRLGARPRALPGGALVVALAILLLFLDLHVTPFAATRADGGNRAYAALRGKPGRLFELPVFRPESSVGSIYLYYDTQLRHERPEGYSTTARPTADRVATALLPLNCGDWTGGEAKLLRQLGVRSVAFHGGLYAGGSVEPGTAWFAWRALIRRGWKPLARDGAVTTFVQHGIARRPPVPQPKHNFVLLCDGWYPNDGNGRAMSLEHAPLWVYDSGDVRLFVKSQKPLRVVFTVNGNPVVQRRISKLAEVRVPVGGRGWHLLALDARLPKVNGRPEGARLVGYALS